MPLLEVVVEESVGVPEDVAEGLGVVVVDRLLVWEAVGLKVPL